MYWVPLVAQISTQPSVSNNQCLKLKNIEYHSTNCVHTAVGTTRAVTWHISEHTIFVFGKYSADMPLRWQATLNYMQRVLIWLWKENADFHSQATQACHKSCGRFPVGNHLANHTEGQVSSLAVPCLVKMFSRLGWLASETQHFPKLCSSTIRQGEGIFSLRVAHQLNYHFWIQIRLFTHKPHCFLL